MQRRAQGEPETDAGAAVPIAPEAQAPRPVSADDLAIASMRLLAVREFQQRRRDLPAEVAAEATVADWRRHPRSQTVEVEERLPGGHTRQTSRTVTVGDFSVSTLRAWTATFEAREDMRDLVPRWKGTRGRNGAEIPEQLLNFVWGVSTSTARADVKKAVAMASEHWPADQFPDVSIRTWQRKILAMDPRKAGKDLNHSVAKYRQEQNPDIEIDWTALAYNARWEIDDIQSDYYILASDRQRTLRPFCYAIIRCATRQLVAMVTSEVPIVQEQIRALVAAALVSDHGGIPAEIKFERGHTASDPHLEMLLRQLGCKVGRTSMDGGQVFTGATPDGASGHFQGKPLIEANARRWHNQHWAVPTQVGPVEKDTAPARLENELRLAREAAKRGETLRVITSAQWHALEREMCEKFNTTPHSGLPLVVDPETGKPRHMTPNEAAREKRAEAIRVMHEELLPLFYMKGLRVPVTQNGIRVGNVTYGRFDDDLRALAEATVYVSETTPDLAFVSELGRLVERYEPANYGDASAQFQGQRHTEKRFRNQYDAAMAQVMATMQNGISLVSVVNVPSNPCPERVRAVADCPELRQRATAIRSAVSRWQEEKAAEGQRFAFETVPGSAGHGERPRGSGLLARAGELQEHVEALNGGGDQPCTL
jgi:hypothetical protein